MTINRIPVVTTADPDAYSNGIISSGANCLNVLYTDYPGEKVYASQRPSIHVDAVPDDIGAPATQGRGITYWDEVGTFYFVRANWLYRSDYGTPIQNLGTSFRDKVFFAEVNDYLIIIDPEGNAGYYIDKALPLNVTPIGGTVFPPNQTPALQLVGGAVSLHGYIFVMTTDGRIWNSNLNDPTTWTGIDFITADVSTDEAVMIAKHHNHICAISRNSVEFFYDAGNPTGSPLQLRQDISFSTGAIDFNSTTVTGENVLFLGKESSGTIGLFRLESFKLNRLSADSIDRYISNTYSTQSTVGDSMSFILSSGWVGSHLMCFLTSVGVTSTGAMEYIPQYTLAYDATNKLWSRFDTVLDSIDEFGVVGTTDSSGSTGSRGSIMFLSGATATMDLTGVSADYRTHDEYFEPDYIVDGYMVVAPDSIFNNIEVNITTVEYDMESTTNKSQHRLSLVGTTSGAGGDLTDINISWTDDRYRSFSNPRALKTGLRRGLTRGGLFRRRAYSLDYNGGDLLRLESLEVDTRGSQYA